MKHAVFVFGIAAAGLLVAAACGQRAQPTAAPPPAQPTATTTPAPPAPTTAPAPPATTAPAPVTAPSFPPPTGPAKLAVATSAQLGKMLVDDQGRSLYLFTKDEAGLTNCYDQCAQNWPPFLTKGAPEAGDGAAKDLLGTTARKDGSEQVTYNGWPLYYWVRDAKAGDTTGQNVGKVWFVVSADGGPIQTEMLVKVIKNPVMGSIVADASGRALYIFTRDVQGTSNCYDACAQHWPPALTIGAPTAGDAVAKDLLSTVTRKDGSVQLAYNGWPLYYWWKDAKPGDTAGQDVGKVWFVQSPDGSPIQNNALVKTIKNDKLGTFLADRSGRALYLFTRDELNVTNCYDQCAQRWPPMLSIGTATAGEGVANDLLGFVTRKDGSIQLTYNGWPLYYWWKDAKPGDTAGQNVGNVWFVLSTYGGPIQNSAAVKIAKNSNLGDMLADASGRTLYMFTRDQGTISNCYDQCAQRWPPLLTNGAPVAGEGMNKDLLGTTTRKDGGIQVTYNGMPLYYWWRDNKPGDATGQNVGGVWFVVGPDGSVIKGPAPSM